MDFTKQMKEDRLRAQVAIALAAAAVGAPMEEIVSDVRRTKVAFARQVAMYVAYVGFGMSLARVAAAFGRDKSTIAYACRVIEDRRDEPAFDRWMEALEASAAGAPVAA
ncbi:MAG: helix-turn-helix domain-containing protein [Hyphomonadaceae bacterium]